MHFVLFQMMVKCEEGSGAVGACSLSYFERAIQLMTVKSKKCDVLVLTGHGMKSVAHLT